MAKPTCYVCLESCENEFSPCECKIPVHAECLERFMCSDGRTECSVCKSPLEIEHFELDIDEMPDVILRPRVPRRRFGFHFCIAVYCIATYYFALYCIAGWFGKLVHLLASETAFEFDADFWDMFTPLHAICAIIVGSIVLCIFRMGMVPDRS